MSAPDKELNVTAFWRKVVVTLGYFAAGMIILAALLVSVSRLMVPVLNEHRADFEKFASHIIDRQVHIEKINIIWNVFEPELALQSVTVLDQQTSKPVLNIPLIKINLAFWRSLFKREFALNSITISGVHLTLHQQASGEINLKGFTTGFSLTDNLTGGTLNTNAVIAWIFSQPNLILENMAVQFISVDGMAKSIRLKQLALYNRSNQHQLLGKATLKQEVPTKITLDFKWEGDVTDPSQISANLYLYLEGISLPQWVSGRSWHDLTILQGLGNAKIQALWNKNTWQKMAASLQFYHIEAESRTTQKKLKISRINGNFGWERVGADLVLQGDNILLDLPKHLWPNINFNVRYEPLSDGTFKIKHIETNYIDLADGTELATVSGLLPADYQLWLTRLNPKGELHDLNLNIKGPLNELASYFVTTNFSGITLDAFEQIPSVTNLQGVIDWNGKQGELKLNSQNAALNFKQIFANPLSFDQFTFDLRGQQDANGAWILNTKNLQAINQDINARLDAILTLPKDDFARIDLSGNFTLKNAAHVSDYLPLKIFSSEFVTWLRNAFISGQVTEGKAILQGRLHDFPFDESTGKFEISGLAQNMEFNYAPNWPMMHNVNGKLLFSGRSMTIDLFSGKILAIPIQSAHAEIPSLGGEKPQVLTVKGHVQSDLAEGMNFIQHSILQHSIGKSLAELQLKGPMQLDLGLTIPLAAPNETKVAGKTTISNATVNLPDWNVTLQNLTGNFSFTEESISASNLTGQLFSHPVTLNLSTEHPKGKSGYIAAELQGVISTDDLKNGLALPVDQVLQGTTAYRAELHLPHQGQSSQPTEIIVHSDLKGMAVDLPDRYGKKAETAMDFQFLLNTSDNQPLKTKLIYDKLFSIAMTLQRVKQKFTLLSGNLNLGESDASWQTQPGIIITGHLDQLNWDKLQPYITQFTAKKTSTEKTNQPFVDPSLFRAVDIKVNAANLAGMKLNQVRIQLTKQNNNFLLGLNSAEMAGQILLPSPGSSQAIQAKFQYLHFTPQSESSMQASINPKTLPAIAFVSDDVRYADMDLGQVTLNLVPSSGGLLIRQLDLDSPAYKMHATGDWTGSANQSTTRLQGNINTSDVSAVLKAWGFSSSNFIGSKGDADFDLHWQGAPFKPSMQGLSGTITLNLGKGRIINLSESTDAKMGLGRLLSVFSLQSLPRRLSLDFSDLFEKGYSFDSLKGDFSLKNGNATTQNTEFNGPIAGIAITGRIGFIAKDFDLKLNVTPYVGSSLPVITALATVNPIAGIATWMVGNAMSQLITYTYTITGSWDNPIWTQVGKQKTTQPRR